MLALARAGHSSGNTGLSSRGGAVLCAGGRLLGGSLPIVALTSDKHATAEHLLRHGVPAPQGRVLEPPVRLPRDYCYPAVLKPLDGAGSQDVRLVRDATRDGT